MCEEGEAPAFANETYPVARKKYVCCECVSEISVGEKHQCITGLWDKFRTFRTCLICSNIRSAAGKELDYDIAIGKLYETVGSEFEESI